MWVTTPALAETPNLQPGMWSHTTTTSVEGPMSMAPQSTTSQQCLTQEQVNKGVDMLEIPKQCSVTKMNVMRDTADFALTCNIQGMPMAFIGHSAFHGDNMNGQMSSEVDTPVGKMLMSMDFTAKRIGECP
jgi:hypothetical protein